MCSKLLIFLSILSIYRINGAVLLWSKHKFQISPLKSFSNDDFTQLIQELGYPETAIYRSPSTVLVPGFKELLDGYYTAYSPNGDVNMENATEISGEDDLELLKIKQQLESSQDNVLSVIVIPNGRPKREALFISSTTESAPPDKILKGGMFYSGINKKDETYGLLYSSAPMQLKYNNATILLGRGVFIAVDTWRLYTRLTIHIPTDEGGKVSLRFAFAWQAGYSSLRLVVVDNTYNLTTQQDITSPGNFSYHCSGATVFSDSDNSIELTIYDMQIQISSTDPNKFNDAYDCVTFTTGPIWSGLFVTAILGVGLIIALSAIANIKTMDKFDNHKTKQLAITVTE